MMQLASEEEMLHFFVAASNRTSFRIMDAVDFLADLPLHLRGNVKLLL